MRIDLPSKSKRYSDLPSRAMPIIPHGDAVAIRNAVVRMFDVEGKMITGRVHTAKGIAILLGCVHAKMITKIHVVRKLVMVETAIKLKVFFSISL
jgi:hypothetical protein